MSPVRCAQARDGGGQVLLHEVYRTREDFKAHQEQPHYFRWRDRVPDLLAEPRSGVKYVNVYPKDEEW